MTVKEVLLILLKTTLENGGRVNLQVMHFRKTIVKSRNCQKMMTVT